MGMTFLMAVVMVIAILVVMRMGMAMAAAATMDVHFLGLNWLRFNLLMCNFMMVMSLYFLWCLLMDTRLSMAVGALAVVTMAVIAMAVVTLAVLSMTMPMLLLHLNWYLPA
jgi:hypothetical protein